MRVAGILVVGLCTFLGCASSAPSGPPADPYPSCKNGKYVLDDPATTPSGFDSAACVEFMKAIPTIQTDGTKAPAFITPLAGAILPSTPIAKFTWSKGQLSMMDGPTIWDEIRRELVLEKTAHAAVDAGSTFTSDAYVVVFRAAASTDGGGLAEILRVMTINLDYTPSDKAWAAMQSVGSIEASVYGMHFDNGKITSGPFTAPQARAFSVAQ